MSKKGIFLAGLAVGAIALLVFLAWPRQWHFAEPGVAHDPIVLPAAGRFPFQIGEELEYEFGWQGMPAAALHMAISAVDQNGQRYLELSYEIRTMAALKDVWSFEATGKTLMDSRTLLPVASETASRKGDREKRTTTRFDRAAGIASVQIWKSHKKETEQKQIRSDGAVDIPSTFLLLRAMPLTLQRSSGLRVLDGDDIYEVVVTPLRTGRVDSAAGSFDATELDLRVRKMPEEPAGDRASLQKYRRMRVWVSQGSRMPVKLEADIVAGQVYAELIRFRSPTVPPG